MIATTAALRSCFIAGFLLAAPAAEASLLGIDHNTGALYDISTSTGTASVRATFTYAGQALTGAIGLAFSSGQLYTVTDSTTVSAPRSLFRLDPDTGATSLVGGTGLGFIREGDLAADPRTGVLFGGQLGDGTVDSALFTLNTATALAAPLPPTAGARDLSSLAFTAAGTLYAIDDLPGIRALYTLDPTTGQVLSRVPLAGYQLGERAGLAQDPASGILYYADDTGPNFPGTRALYTLDPTSGVLTTVGPLGATVANLSGLAFTPIPEPASLALLAAVLPMTLAWQRQTGRV